VPRIIMDKHGRWVLRIIMDRHAISIYIMAIILEGIRLDL
jgi:hypothetical protein